MTNCSSSILGLSNFGHLKLLPTHSTLHSQVLLVLKTHYLKYDDPPERLIHDLQYSKETLPLCKIRYH